MCNLITILLFQIFTLCNALPTLTNPLTAYYSGPYLDRTGWFATRHGFTSIRGTRMGKKKDSPDTRAGRLEMDDATEHDVRSTDPRVGLHGQLHCEDQHQVHSPQPQGYPAKEKFCPWLL
jgi:hypothetical protein